MEEHVRNRIKKSASTGRDCERNPDVGCFPVRCTALPLKDESNKLNQSNHSLLLIGDHLTSHTLLIRGPGNILLLLGLGSVMGMRVVMWMHAGGLVNAILRTEGRGKQENEAA